MRYWHVEGQGYVITDDDKTPDDCGYAGLTATELDREPGEFDAFDVTLNTDTARLDKFLHDRIDRECGDVRGRFITVIAAQDVMYHRKADQAHAYLADSNAPVPSLDLEAAARGITVADLAAEVVALEAQWLAILDATEAARLGAKDAVTAAASINEKYDAAVVNWDAVIAGAMQ